MPCRCCAAGRGTGHRFPRTPGDYRPLLYRPAWPRLAARLRPEVMTPDCLSLRGMAPQCSRTHDQDVQGLKVVRRASTRIYRGRRGRLPAPPGVGLAAPLSRRPLNPEGGRIHTCPVSPDSAGVLAAVLMTLTEGVRSRVAAWFGDNPSTPQRRQPRIAVRLTPARPLPAGGGLPFEEVGATRMRSAAAVRPCRHGTKAPTAGAFDSNVGDSAAKVLASADALTTDVGEVSGVSDGGEFIRV